MNTNTHPGRIAVEKLEQGEVTLGFIPLTDCAPLVIAQERGLFAECGLEVTLSKETSWANNGNAVTISEPLYRRMVEADPEAMAGGEGEPPLTARALKAVIDDDCAKGRAPLTFATVYPFSTHNYLLRYWMAAAGIDPDRDVRLTVVPPPQMVGKLSEGAIDGYCVGEPWNQAAVQSGLGRVVVTSYEIWNNHPEKVLGVTEEWAEQNPSTHRALIMALLEAARWMDRAENRLEVVEKISGPRYVNAPEHVVRMSMAGVFQYAQREMPRALRDFNVFHRYAANVPGRSHGLWMLTQMVRWGQVAAPSDARAVCEAVYRPGIYREAAQALGLPAPTVDYKGEGTHGGAWSIDGISLDADRFLDGRRFDPNSLNDYLTSFEVTRSSKEQILFPTEPVPARAG